VRSILLLLFAAVFVAPLHAQTAYRWVDANGKVHYSDQPPPPNARKVDRRKLTPSQIETGGLSYAVKIAAEKYPVQLFTSPSCGSGCEEGRALLKGRGVPFKELKISSDQDLLALQKHSPNREVPTLLVGNEVQRGFLASAWNSSLDAAGYPKSAPPVREPKNPPKPSATPPAAPPAATGGEPAAAK
jgi:hypothetical protein